MTLSKQLLPWKFEKNFKERTLEAWYIFSQNEEKLRQLMNNDNSREKGDEIIRLSEGAFDVALTDVDFTIGYNGKRFEVIFSPNGSKVELFKLIYFINHAPKDLLEDWSFSVGRKADSEFYLSFGDLSIGANDVQLWVEKTGKTYMELGMYCSKLALLPVEQRKSSHGILCFLASKVVGELNLMAFVDSVNILAEPLLEKPYLLSDLPALMENMNLDLNITAEEYLDCGVTYGRKPNEDDTFELRMDVLKGFTSCPSLFNEYLDGAAYSFDALYTDGAVAGFICYSLEEFVGEDKVEKVMAFNQELRKYLEKYAGSDVYTYIGDAVGQHYGYLDVIAWDLPALLENTAEFFKNNKSAKVDFYGFKRDSEIVNLWQGNVLPADVNETTGSILSAEDIEAIESFMDDGSGYFYKMVDDLDSFVAAGISEGRFTERQAREDLQLALWYAYAYNNLDRYDFYWKTLQWMPDSEKNASGCATWYYRYSVALMYCNKLEMAHKYAELGAVEEPDYPWNWLQVGKLRSYFGDKEGALEAAEQGLRLVPNDHEFLTLRREILENASIEQMEYHWINPDADNRLQEGLDEDADEKQQSISCIRINEAGLLKFKELFDLENWEADNPNCCGNYSIGQRKPLMVFRMNQAGLSKLNYSWLEALKEKLDSGCWLEAEAPEGKGKGVLEAVIVNLDYSLGLGYAIADTERNFQLFLDKEWEMNSYWVSEDKEAEQADKSCSPTSTMVMNESSWLS